MNQLNCLTNENWHYLAGFLEGEGCFYWQRRKLVSGNYSYHPKIIFESTDFDIAQRIAIWFGVKPQMVKKRKPHYKQSWQVVKIGKEARFIMEKIKPLMGVRRKAKIEEILAMTHLYQ